MKFSVIIPLYNKQSYIKRAIESVLSQSYNDFEVIVVNDGSTDNSLQEALSITDSRLRIIDKPNGGVSSARNRGIDEAKNEWICFLDGDDILYSNALEEYAKLHCLFPEINVLCGSIDVSVKSYPAQQKRYIIDNYYKANIYSEMRTGVSVLCTDCICIHRSCFDAVGVFNSHFTHGEDLDMWDRLQSKYMFAKSEIPVAYYDMAAENRSDLTLTNVGVADTNPIKGLSITSPLYMKLIKGGEQFYGQVVKNNNRMIGFFNLFFHRYIILFLFVKTLFRIGIINKRG